MHSKLPNRDAGERIGYGRIMPEQLAVNRLDMAQDADRERLRLIFDQAPGFMAMFEGADHRLAFANRAFCDLVGRDDLTGRTVAEAFPEFAGQPFVDLLDRAASTGESLVGRAVDMRVTRPGEPEEEIFVDILFQPLPAGDGGPAVTFVQGHEVTGDKRSEAIRQAHNKVLELAVGDSPLEDTLGELIRIVESTSRTGVIGTILLLDEDGKHLRHGAAPSMPKSYCDAIDGAEIGPRVGSCGTAAYTAAPVFVTDISTDPLWAAFRELALAHDLKACWSIPIMTAGRKVLGTFAMYHHEPREPTVRDLALVDLITQTAALVIDRDRAKAALHEIAALTGIPSR